MTGSVMVPAVMSPVTTAPQKPLVRMGGAVQSECIPRLLAAEGLLDERCAFIDLSRYYDSPGGEDLSKVLHYHGREISLDWFLQAGDCCTHILNYFRGTIEELRLRADGKYSLELFARDAWSYVLDRVIDKTWLAGAGEYTVPVNAAAVMQVGERPNRSRKKYRVGNSLIYVFEEGGEPWRLADVLTYFSVTENLYLRQDLLTETQRLRPLVSPLPVRGKLRNILKTLFEREQLQIDRSDARPGSVKGFRCRPVERGRRVTLSLTSRGEARSLVEKFRCRVSRRRETSFVTPGSDMVINDTFALSGNWDPALEGADPARYGRSDPDFLLYAEVFRRWVLNTADINMTDAASPMFADLSHNQVHLRGGGVSQVTDPETGMLLEYSIDGGVTWQKYTGRFIVAADRAEILITDGTLPAELINAGNTSLLRIRLTAELVLPGEKRKRRVLGNVLTDYASGSGQGSSDNDDGLRGNLPGGGDDGSRTFPGDPGQGGTGDPDDNDGEYPVVPHSGGSAVRDNLRSEMHVTLGPVDPGLRVGDLVTQVRGGRSPAVCLHHSAGARIERIDHDCSDAQVTRLVLVPVHYVQ